MSSNPLELSSLAAADGVTTGNPDDSTEESSSCSESNSSLDGAGSDSTPDELNVSSGTAAEATLLPAISQLGIVVSSDGTISGSSSQSSGSFVTTNATLPAVSPTGGQILDTPKSKAKMDPTEIDVTSPLLATPAKFMDFKSPPPPDQMLQRKAVASRSEPKLAAPPLGAPPLAAEPQLGLPLVPATPVLDDDEQLKLSASVLRLAVQEALRLTVKPPSAKKAKVSSKTSSKKVAVESSVESSALVAAPADSTASGASSSKSASGKEPMSRSKLKKRKDKKDSDKYKEERYNKTVRKCEEASKRAEAAAKAAEGAEAEHPSVAKQSKPRNKHSKKKKRKNKKNKKSKAPSSSSSSSSDSSSSSSESSDSSSAESDTAPRISTISDGRRLRQVAIARTKELGLLVDESIRPTRVAAGLRVIDEIEIHFDPSMAYPDFFQIPGTGLPHMKKYYDEFNERHSAFARANAKFHLTQLQSRNTAKAQLLGPSLVNHSNPMWQFANDMAHGPDRQVVVPSDPVVVPAPVAIEVQAQPALEPSKNRKKRKSRSESLSEQAEDPAKKAKREPTGSKSGKKSRKRRRSGDSSSELPWRPTLIHRCLELRLVGYCGSLPLVANLLQRYLYMSHVA